MIESHKEDYTNLPYYYSPEEIIEDNLVSTNYKNKELYNTAHCYVSERHSKGDLVDLIFFLLKKLDKTAVPLNNQSYKKHRT